jgi:RecJ-like exonuclease
MPFVTVTCPQCEGAGKHERPYGFSPCSLCRGSGKIDRYTPSFRDKAEEVGGKVLLAIFVVLGVVVGTFLILMDALG